MAEYILEALHSTTEAAGSAYPMVSILMPVRNEEDFISEALDAVVAQDYPSDRIEIIVADGLSSDRTREIVQSYIERHPNIRLVDNPKQIAPTALNIATSHSRGDVLIRVDGHCRISRSYVSRCVSYLNDADVDGVGGPLETVSSGVFGAAIAVAMSSNFGVGGSAFRTTHGKTMLVDSIAFPAYKRSAVQAAGGYDEQLVRNQDDEYNYRMRKLGLKLLLAADVQSVYYSRSSIRRLFKQYLQYGFWKVRVLQKHPGQMSLRQFVPGAFVLSLLFGIALLPSFGPQFLATVAGSYVVANVSATLITSAARGWRHAAILPFAFTAMHVSYGLGFLAGIPYFSLSRTPTQLRPTASN